MLSTSTIICFRNRLESNTEHWNALLLSLRELVEWVIRKDTELTGLGPVCGDVAALQKQQVCKNSLFTFITKLYILLYYGKCHIYKFNPGLLYWAFGNKLSETV